MLRYLIVRSTASARCGRAAPGGWTGQVVTLLLALVVAILFAQSMGQLHRVKHRSTGTIAQSAVAASASSIATASASAPSWLSRVFLLHDEGSPDCRLLDQSQHDAAVVGVAALALPALPMSSAVALFAGAAQARWAALFDARGPPTTH